MRIFSILVIFLLCIINVRADTYYVSNTGNNSYGGDQNNPWKTLQYAADHADPGDTVIVEPGNYIGFYMDASGSVNNPIVFKAMPGAIGQDMHSLISSPEEIFVNIQSNNYHLIEGCDAMDNGTSSKAPRVDLDGYPRPIGLGYDIGAYEYTGLTGTQTFSKPGHQLLVYPNPASEYFVIKSEILMDRIEIITSDGKIVQSIHAEGENALTVPVEGLKKELLFIRVFSGNNCHVSHLIIP